MQFCCSLAGRVRHQPCNAVLQSVNALIRCPGLERVKGVWFGYCRHAVANRKDGIPAKLPHKLRMSDHSHNAPRSSFSCSCSLAELKGTDTTWIKKGELACLCVCLSAAILEADGAGQVLVIPGARDMESCLEGTWEQRHKGKKSWQRYCRPSELLCTAHPRGSALL